MPEELCEQVPNSSKLSQMMASSDHKSHLTDVALQVVSGRQRCRAWQHRGPDYPTECWERGRRGGGAAVCKHGFDMVTVCRFALLHIGRKYETGVPRALIRTILGSTQSKETKT